MPNHNSSTDMTAHYHGTPSMIQSLGDLWNNVVHVVSSKVTTAYTADQFVILL
jgi:hypothetical protein